MNTNDSNIPDNSPDNSPKKKWKGLKRNRVLAYLRGIARKGKNVWTWINIGTLAKQLDVSYKTVWRVVSNLANKEKGEFQDNELCVRLCQRKTGKNFHFQYMISARKNLLHDMEPLYSRVDGKSRNLRLRCRNKNLPGTMTKSPLLVQQQERDSTPAEAAAADTAAAKFDNLWKKQVLSVEKVFWCLGIPTYAKPNPIDGARNTNNRVMTHSPFKRENDKNPSCCIYVDEDRFHDFSTGTPGNQITLARIANRNPDMPFQDAIAWLKTLPPHPANPRAWWNPTPPTKSEIILNNLMGDYGKKLVVPPRKEGIYRLAWVIYKEQIQGINVSHKPYGMVGLIAKSLKRGDEKSAVVIAIQSAIKKWKDQSAKIEVTDIRAAQNSMRGVWRHPNLKNAYDAEQIKMSLSSACFIKELKHALDFAFIPPETSPEVGRNTDPAAVEMFLNQISNLFTPLEHVWITDNIRSRGWCRTAKYWQADISKNGVPTGANGAWIKQNPMTIYGIGNNEVTSFRHCLLEADSISLEDQIKLVKTKFPYPVVSVVHSGGKSIHILLKVATTRETYPELVKQLHEQFPVFDRACKDPARWTRLAGAIREGKLQAALPIDPVTPPDMLPPV